MDFIKIFLLYLEGVISLKDFYMLFDGKFGSRIKMDLQKDIDQLFPTRENARRVQSDILKPWYDIENQKFTKIPDSTYYKINEGFPLPMQSAKLDPKNGDAYHPFLNEKYLMLSIGSENFKFKDRNLHENMIFKNEDEMYRLYS